MSNHKTCCSLSINHVFSSNFVSYRMMFLFFAGSHHMIYAMQDQDKSPRTFIFLFLAFTKMSYSFTFVFILQFFAQCSLFVLKFGSH